MALLKHRITVVDATILTTLDDCPRKAQYAFQYGRVPRGTSLPLEFGRTYHDIVHRYYELNKNLEEALAGLALSNLPSKGEEEDLRTMEKVEELVRARDRLFRSEEWKYLGGEQQFAIEIPGISLPFSGFIDAFGRETYGEERYVIQEEKTSKSPWYFCPHPNMQVTGYVFAARTLFQADIRRAYVTMAGIFKSSVDGKMPGKRKIDPPREVVNRYVVDTTPWDLDEFVEDVREKVEEIKTFEGETWWPKRTKSCGAYGGCPYAPICLAPPGMREMFLESQFDERLWNPMDERR